MGHGPDYAILRTEAPRHIEYSGAQIVVWSGACSGIRSGRRKSNIAIGKSGQKRRVAESLANCVMLFP